MACFTGCGPLSTLFNPRITLVLGLGSFLAFLKVNVDTLAAMLPGTLDRLVAMNPRLGNDLREMPAGDMQLRNRFIHFNAALAAEVMVWLMNGPVANQSAFDHFLQIVNDYPDRVPLEGLRNMVFQALLFLGMCPAGVQKEALGYWVQEGQEWQRHDWSTCYNWTPEGPVPLAPAPAHVGQHVSRMHSLLMGELMYALFPHRARTFESLGQGIVTFRPTDDPTDHLVQAINAVIRFLGLRRKHPYADYFQRGDDFSLPAHVEDCLNQHANVPSAQVVRQMRASQALIGGEDNAGLEPDRLYLSRALRPLKGPDRDSDANAATASSSTPPRAIVSSAEMSNSSLAPHKGSSITIPIFPRTRELPSGSIARN